ncbi:hypothetical protein N8895_00240 [Candidatus Pelagibacter sp.]|nr:hypothetical protein [Candidatus Pelagibacter sp.]
MKRFLGIIAFSLFLSISAFSEQIKLKEINLDTGSKKFKKIKSKVRGNIEGIDFINYFYEYREGNKLKGFIDIFDLDNSGLYEGRVNMWFRSQVFKINTNQACSPSNRNIFFRNIDFNTHIACLNIKIINKDELSLPSFKPHHQVNIFPRMSIIKNFVKKNEIIVPNKMIRAEHYFYKVGQVNWIFFSLDIDVNSEEEINKFIKKSFQNHQKFEEQLKIPKNTRFVFKDINFNKKKVVKEKTKKEKKKVVKKYELKGERSIALSWEGYEDLIAGTVSFDETDYKGTLNLPLPNNDGTCDGTYSLQEGGKGTWQIACSNNMGAAGTLKWVEDGGVTGSGRDHNDKKVKFTISKNN